jgi:hypothetical protein
MKRYIVVLWMLACTGCAPVTTKVNLPDIGKSDSLSISDMRPASEKERKIFSFLTSSDKYGIVREGDTRLSPSPVRLLQYQVFDKFNASGHLPKVAIYHFVVYQNTKVQRVAETTGVVVGGLIGALIAQSITDHDVPASTQLFDEKTFNAQSSDEYQHGLFTKSENPKKGAVYIVYIDTDINGKKVFTRTIAPIHKHGDQDPLASAIQLAIKNHLDHYDANAPIVVTPDVAAAPAQAAPVATSAMLAEQDAAPAPPSASKSMAASAASAPDPSQMSAASAAVMSMAQDVATQLGCGAVQVSGDATYIAPCSNYSVLIDCSGDQCRPMHTVNVKHDE